MINGVNNGRGIQRACRASARRTKTRATRDTYQIVNGQLLYTVNVRADAVVAKARAAATTAFFMATLGV